LLQISAKTLIDLLHQNMFAFLVKSLCHIIFFKNYILQQALKGF